MSQEELAHIERYWAKELSEKELQDFQIRYKTDPSFASQVDLFREAQEAVEVLGQQKLKEAFRQQYKSEAKKVKKLPKRWMLVAAAVLVFLIAFALWPKGEGSSLSPAELYTEYYRFEPLSLERGAHEMDSLFLLANSAFNAKAFDKAIPLLQDLINDTSFVRRDYAQLHLGISRLETHKEENALVSLSKISKNSSFYFKAQWNIALINLKLGKLEKARSTLKLLEKESRSYRENAAKILESI